MRHLLAAASVLSLAILFIAPAPAGSAKSSVVFDEGAILKITRDDITIKTVGRKRDWFALPRRARIFYADGTTPYPRESLLPGLRVRVFYDWQALTYVRAADHIIVLPPAGDVLPSC
jgi:hypothetical protein